MRIALITACYGSYDPVRPLPDDHGFDDAVLVTDDRSFGTDTVSRIGWRVHLENSDESPRLAAKRPKMMPWLYTDCDAAVWLDASFEIIGVGFRDWAEAHLVRNDFVVWSHPEGRICIRQEADVCWEFPKYKDQPIREQVGSYLRDGFPGFWGLFAAGTVGYRFTDEAKRFGSLWHSENVKWSIQDQISLPYLLWREGKPFGLWGANEYQNPFVKVRWDQRPNNEL
jgi:hypothetical protein